MSPGAAEESRLGDGVGAGVVRSTSEEGPGVANTFDPASAVSARMKPAPAWLTTMTAARATRTARSRSRRAAGRSPAANACTIAPNRHSPRRSTTAAAARLKARQSARRIPPAPGATRTAAAAAPRRPAGRRPPLRGGRGGRTGQGRATGRTAGRRPNVTAFDPLRPARSYPNRSDCITGRREGRLRHQGARWILRALAGLGSVAQGGWLTG